MKNIKVEKVGKEHIFISDSVVGETDRVYIHPSEMEYFAQREERIKQLELDRDRNNMLLGSTLKALGVTLDEHKTNMSLLCETLLGVKIQFDNEQYVTLESIDGYIKAKAQGNLYKKAYIDLFPDLLNGCHKELEDGTVVLDEDKFNEMMMAVL